MLRKKAGVFCHNGLGDGVNCLVLSENLHQNGWEVQTYQNSIGSMQNWFSHLPVNTYPKLDRLEEILSAYDMYFVVQNDSDPFVLELIKEGKKRFPDRIKVLYYYASPNIIKEPYYSDCLTDPKKSIAENLCTVCSKVIGLPKVQKSNGFTPLKGLVFRKNINRIAIHPTSSSLTRSWPKKKFVKLALQLKKKGYEVGLIPGSEIENWRDVPNVLEFLTLSDVAAYIYESGYHIGNDSGLGHIASALGIPTLTLCRRKALAYLWAPSFAKNIVVTPPSILPNIRGLRLRDRKWKSFITNAMVLRGFKKLTKL